MKSVSEAPLCIGSGSERAGNLAISQPLSWSIGYGVSVSEAPLCIGSGSERAGDLAIPRPLFPLERGGFKPELSNFLIV